MEPNPYLSAVEQLSPDRRDSIRRNADIAAATGLVGALLCGLTAPIAIYFGTRALSDIKRWGSGTEHRGAARVGLVLGCLFSALLVLGVLFDFAGL